MLPLEHLMVHQMALTSFDMPVRMPAAPNAPQALMSMQTVRSAMLVRSLLIKDGVSSAAHLRYARINPSIFTASILLF